MKFILGNVDYDSEFESGASFVRQRMLLVFIFTVGFAVVSAEFSGARRRSVSFAVLNIVFSSQVSLLLGSVLLDMGFWMTGPRAVYGLLRILEKWSFWYFSVRYLVHWLESVVTVGTSNVLILASQCNLTGVYTHSINANNYYALL
jgi:hypothetical protein